VLFTRHFLQCTILACTLYLVGVSTLAQTVDPSPKDVLRRPVAHGIYQLAYSASQNALYAASAESIPNVQGGLIYKLDPQTLETVGLIHTDERNFGLAIDPAGDTLFITNRRASALSKMDTKTGRITRRVAFSERRPNGSPYGPRTVLYDSVDRTLYVGGMGDPGLIWVLDPESLTVRTTITGAGKGVTGLLRDPHSSRIFAATVDGEILLIDTQTLQITQRWKPAGDEPALPLNLALDQAGKRLFVTDNSRLKTLMVLDAQSGALQQQIPVGESLDVQYQAQQNILVLTHRERGMVSVLDATTYRIKQQIDLPPHPNSLIFSPDGQTVYVSIKVPTERSPLAPGRYAQGMGSVARIALQTARP